jgi:hypothetical protein
MARVGSQHHGGKRQLGNQLMMFLQTRRFSDPHLDIICSLSISIHLPTDYTLLYVLLSVFCHLHVGVRHPCFPSDLSTEPVCTLTSFLSRSHTTCNTASRTKSDNDACTGLCFLSRRVLGGPVSLLSLGV